MRGGKFNLSNYKLLSCNMGELVPINLTEVLPGDMFKGHSSVLLRVSPLLAPVMHPVVVRIHHWFVPHRLSWDEWEDFITGGPDNDSTPTFPTITWGSGGATPGELADYLGVPPSVNGLVTSALPIRAYQRIYNEWYRDQDLEQPGADISTASGSDSTTYRLMQRISWEKDYFTVARPWPQKGADVTIPMSGQANVVRSTNAANPIIMRRLGASTPSTSEAGLGTDSNAYLKGNTSGLNINIDPNNTLYSDLATATGATINELRAAFALQRFAENRARFGSRYTEYLAALGVRSSDARLQRPEYLGGGKQTIQFSEVLQTSVTTDGDDTVGVGNLKGHGIAAMRSNKYRRFFEEHGYVITLMSVRPKTIYQDGLHRTWNRRTKEDFWQPELEHIGQQSILNKEVYAPAASPDAEFGWIDRYDEYRGQPSSVAGAFRDSLDFWHLARQFTTTPVLNGTFTQCNPSMRIFADQATEPLWVMANNTVVARRKVSKNATPIVF